MWKCPACQIDVDDSVQQCPQCGYVQTQPATNPATTSEGSAATSEGKITWPYSGKAFRAWWIFNCFLTLVLVALGVVLMVQEIISGNSLKIVWGIIVVILLIKWLYFFCSYWYKTNFIQYRLAEAHLYYERGLFRRTIDTMELIGIADLRMQQTLWDRFINGGVGTVEVFSVSDKTDETLKMVGLENPQEVLEKIDNARRRLRGRGFVQM
jgi:membrane protein YdbS with pleckstrin-like domain